ncbi:MAG: hypothetical protein HY216_00690 [Candidatus Rokubacteria bacterium]|nr:hypothetical protein [Candidatus Rokubacteria bacterium]
MTYRISQAPVQLLVLLQDALGCGLEIIACAREQVRDCRPGQILWRQAEALGLEA